MATYHKGKGALFIKAEREPGQPHFNGYIEVTQEQIAALQFLLENDIVPRLQVGAWKTKSKKTGVRYIFLGTEVYIKDEDATSAPSRTKSKSIKKAAADGWGDDEDDDEEIPF